jgi:ABC-type transporter Mla maintaining outer membrane lipid asymmetry ATPase subunit MlaF
VSHDVAETLEIADYIYVLLKVKFRVKGHLNNYRLQLHLL